MELERSLPKQQLVRIATVVRRFITRTRMQMLFPFQTPEGSAYARYARPG